MRDHDEEDHQSRVLFQLCALLLSVLRPPPPLPVLYSNSSTSGSMAARRGGVSPVGVASLLLGISLSLMLCGSVTFVIGLVLMPWIFGLAMFFYFVGFVSNLSWLGRAVLMGNPSPPPPPPSPARKERPSQQLLSKFPIL